MLDSLFWKCLFFFIIIFALSSGDSLLPLGCGNIPAGMFACFCWSQEVSGVSLWDLHDVKSDSIFMHGPLEGRGRCCGLKSPTESLFFFFSTQSLKRWPAFLDRRQNFSKPPLTRGSQIYEGVSALGPYLMWTQAMSFPLFLLKWYSRGHHITGAYCSACEFPHHFLNLELSYYCSGAYFCIMHFCVLPPERVIHYTQYTLDYRSLLRVMPPMEVVTVIYKYMGMAEKSRIPKAF